MIVVDIILLILLCISSLAEKFDPVLYGEVTEANCSESLLKLRDVNVRLYEFKYDSMEGRKQMGVLATDAERIFPESIEVIPSYTLPNREKGRPGTTVKNFPMIDKNVFFMHSFAAVKELVESYHSFLLSLREVENSGTDQNAVFEEIERRLSKEADNQVVEEEKIVAAEMKLMDQEHLILEHRKSEEEREKMSELENERKILAYQEELLNIRYYLCIGGLTF
jgi:ATPase family AAA domain-containing protein 3A/B